MKETHRRTVTKTISWRIIATMTTMVIVYIFTGKLDLTLEVGFLEVISKMIFYYFHERTWHGISWGKLTHPLNEIELDADIKPEDMEVIKLKLEEMGYKI